MGSNYKLSYNVDLVFCIDVTTSMDTFLNMVKENAKNLYRDVMDGMEQRKKHVDTLRVRVVAFRDYLADGAQAMLVTNFFDLKTQTEELEACINGLEADGGGDEPEDSYEALAYAMKSDWNTEGNKKRHVIVLWTDDDAHDLGFGKKSPFYPKGMAKDFKELTEWWGNKRDPGFMDQEAKRLIMFAPDMKGWQRITDSWDNVIHCPSDAGDGLREVEYGVILAKIFETI